MTKKMLKQLTGLFLALVMVLSMSVSVFAEPNHEIGKTGEKDCTVTVEIECTEFNFTEDSIDAVDTYSDSISVTVKEGTTVETAVKEAFSKKGWTGEWVEVKDYYDSSIIHDALNSVKIGTKEYATVTKDTDTQWRGAGWTYSGSDGKKEFDTSKYMCDNTIAQSGATVVLTYDMYEYAK